MKRRSIGERKILKRKYTPVVEQRMENKNWLGIERAI
jgi:hypothetical protein